MFFFLCFVLIRLLLVTRVIDVTFDNVRISFFMVMVVIVMIVIVVMVVMIMIRLIV